MNVDHSDVIGNPRFAGEVLRYHTWPTLRRQSVAEHTWQCLRLYLKFWGELPSPVAIYFIWHDAGELVTGDTPFPLKANNPELKVQFDALEATAVAFMGGQNVELSPNEKLRAKFCDLYEMLEFGLVELDMGNQYARPIISGTHAALRRLIERMCSEDKSNALSIGERRRIPLSEYP